MRMFLSALSLTVAAAATTSALADDENAAQGEPDGNRQAEPSASSAAPQNICEALAIAAATNGLPVDFFTRLIWQESRFNPYAVSGAGAQGVAQFMPETARLRAVEDPFNPTEAIAKSAQLLHDLHREFGSLGLAAAAYNAGPGRVRDWLGGRRPLPGETRAYVRIVTGRAAEEWVRGQNELVEIPAAGDVPCSEAATAPVQQKPDASQPNIAAVKPWGVEVVGGPTPSKALTRYREWQLKYPAILADQEPHVVIRGILGNMGAARVRVLAETRADAAKLCTKLRAAGSYCDVLRN
jgi:hypothetical protein